MTDERDEKREEHNVSPKPADETAAPDQASADTVDTGQQVTERPEDSLPELTLDSLPGGMKEAMNRAGWDRLMPVQASACPYLLKGKDIMVQARTGSGKTGAFVLPLMERIDPSKNHCQALVLVPTRELARQVEREANMLAGDTGIRTVAVYGGVGYGPQLEAFKKGAHLVVGTPGRVLDHLLKRSLMLDKLHTLIFDEADRMLSIGFYPDMKDIQRYLPPRGLDSFMFSATFPPLVLRLADEFLRKPRLLSLSGDQVHVAEVMHVFYEVPGMGKERVLVKVIELENPSSAIIFCNTKADVHFVTAVLQQFGYNADELSADLSQSKRESVLTRVREGKLRFLVATDVAARGIDIPNLSHVFLYEPPEDHESYIHRAGRTGRAGASGIAISLVDIMQKMELMRIGAQYKIDFVERTAPTDEELSSVVSQRLGALLEKQLRKTPPISRERLRRFLPQARELAQTEEGLEVLSMLLDREYQTILHDAPPAPEQRPLPGPSRGGRRRTDGGKKPDAPTSDAPKRKRRRRPRKRRNSGDTGGDGN